MDEGVRVTLAELAAAVDMLRARGVKNYGDIAGGGFTIEFFPAPVDMKPEPASKDESKCHCGHATFEHNAGLCILGCDPTRCAPEAK